ncbi:MAG: hypothetical protein NTV43_15815 [Methylococcales bacterium]|nr:hypothetical protein [Methylococcales bacterium]
MAYYKSDKLLTTEESQSVIALPEAMTTIHPIDSTQLEILKKVTANVSPKLRQQFETAFVAWKDTWYAGSLSINSNPNARATGNAFDTLVKLGRESIPLVIEALAVPENFMALSLYHAIQSDQTLFVTLEADDPRVFEGEQGKARLAVQQYLNSL